MRVRVLILIALILVTLLLPSNCWKREPERRDTTQTVVAAPPPPEVWRVAGGRPLTLTLDSLPAEVMAAVKARYPEFVPHHPRDYPASARGTYTASPDDGLSVVRGNLASGATAYAVAGMQGQSQIVVGVVRDANGWTARPISSTGSPPFSPWVTVSRRRRGHPNGRWDAVAVRILDPGGAYDDVYSWHPAEKRFNLGGRAR